MKWNSAAPLVAVGAVVAWAAQIAVHEATGANDNDAPHRAEAVVSYGLGWDLGREAVRNMEQDGVDFDHESMVRGFEAALRGEEPAYDDHRMEIALIEFNDAIFARLHAERLENDPVYQAAAEANAKAGARFRERFAALPGVRRTESGTLHRVDRAGDGPTPELGDTVLVNYRIVTLDGTEVGASVGAVLDTRTMLKTTQELILQMRVGDKWTVAVSQEGSAGLAGRGFGIGPNETIVAEIELLGVNPDEPADG